jgi:heat shock protein HslJ
MRNILLLLSAVFFVSCSTSKEMSTKPYVMWVKGIKVDCEGVGPMKCMLIQKNEVTEPGNWQNFYNDIEGFYFQSGTMFKLLVSEEKLDDSQVPADASTIKYKMVEILEKQPDPVFAVHDIWVVQSIEGNQVQQPEKNSGLNMPSIEINLTEMKIMGTDGCNQFFGPIKNIEEEIIEFGPMGSTMKMCVNMDLPDKLNQAMGKVARYNRTGLYLTFFDSDGNELLQFKKVD